MMIAPEEYMKSEEYKERAFSYSKKVCIDDLKSCPIEYENRIYCSTNKLKRKIERNFKLLKMLIGKNIWRFEGDDDIKIMLGYHLTEREITSVWISFNENAQVAIWIKDKIDLRELPETSVLNFFVSVWNENKKS